MELMDILILIWLRGSIVGLGGRVIGRTWDSGSPDGFLFADLVLIDRGRSLM
jgi:hypothetical protein